MKKSIAQKNISIIITIALALFSGSGPISASEQYELVAEWGDSGDGDGRLLSPLNLATDSENALYVTDSSLNRIQKFTAEGEFITAWGETGKGDGQFELPWGIAVDKEDNVYVSDVLNDRIQKFTSEGEFITSWSTRLKGGLWRLISMPQGLTVDNDGNVYVDHVSQILPYITLPYPYIQKFNPEGILTGKWSFWNIACALATDSAGNLYAPGLMLGLIYKFTPDGALIDQWSICGSSSEELFLCSAFGIALDGEDNVYVSDYVHYSIKKFTPAGEPITAWKLTHSGGFSSPPQPRGLAVDSEGFVYVVDGTSETIKKYAPLTPSSSPAGPHARERGEG